MILSTYCQSIYTLLCYFIRSENIPENHNIYTCIRRAQWQFKKGISANKKKEHLRKNIKPQGYQG